jgi:hypothetical protein
VDTSLSAYKLFDLSFHVETSSTSKREATDCSNSDVRIVFSAPAAQNFSSEGWRLRYRDHDLALEDLAAGDWMRLRYQAGPTFVLKKDGSEISVSGMPSSALHDFETYLFGPISGLLLYLRGLTCLHASAIAREDKALVFVGMAEAGKSTLAATFARKGYRVLTDDILALARASTDIVAKPGIPRIGLWPESVEHLWGDEDALPRQTPTWDKRHFDLTDKGLFQDSALSVGAVYLLADREPNAALRIEPLVGTNAVLALIANKYVTRYAEREQGRRDFVLLSELAASVPVRRVTRNNALTDLNATCEAILADYDALALTPA